MTGDTPRPAQTTGLTGPAATVAERSRPVRLAPIDLLSLGLLGIRIRVMRAVLSALGIAIGIATVIVVTGIPASSQRALLQELTALGSNVLQAWPTPGQDPPIQLPEESVAMVNRIGPVSMASAVANTHAIIRRSDLVDSRDNSGLTVLASKQNLLQTINGTVQAGSFLDDTTDRLPTVVLGSVAAARLGIATLQSTHGPPLVLINNSWFTVIGILRTTPLSPDIDRSALVGWTAARDKLRFDGHPTMIYLKAAEPAIEAVRSVLPATIYPASPGTVQVSRPSDVLAAKRASQNNFSALFLGLAGVALLVGGIGVANTMVISVLERRREIGLRRALGATRGQIRGQFLTESVMLSGLGGLAGTVLGVLATLAYATVQGWPAVIDPPAVAGGFAGAVAIGVVAGLYPAIRASRLTPTEALATA